MEDPTRVLRVMGHGQKKKKLPPLFRFFRFFPLSFFAFFWQVCWRLRRATNAKKIPDAGGISYYNRDTGV